MFPLLKKIEKIMNQALALDARTTQRLLSVKGKFISIEIKHFFKPILIELTEEGIHFKDAENKIDEIPNIKPDVIIQGQLSAFLHLVLTKNAIRAAHLGLRFEGDLEAAEKIQALFLSLEIDWEEWLSEWSGDTIAFQIGTWFKRRREKNSRFLNDLVNSTALYLSEESKLLPTETEVAYFMDNVDKIRSDVDRLAARIKQLETIQ